MYTVGYIDVEKYKMVSKHIRIREVIITGKRVRHIQERRPEGDRNSAISFWAVGDTT